MLWITSLMTRRQGPNKKLRVSALLLCIPALYYGDFFVRQFLLLLVVLPLVSDFM